MTQELLDQAIVTLQNGGVVLLATDTVLGLVAQPSRSDAVDKVYALKQRPRQKNLPIMVAHADQITALGGQLTPSAQALLNSDLMPGPLTLAIALDPTCTPKWLSGRNECAIRIPQDDFLLSILTKLGPLMVTSANLSGQDTAQTTQLALMQLNGVPDLVVHGTAKSQAPSTLVNCTTVPPRFERVGAIPKQRITTILEQAND